VLIVKLKQAASLVMNIIISVINPVFHAKLLALNALGRRLNNAVHAQMDTFWMVFRLANVNTNIL
jgi:ABC-type transporter MlaC component